MNWRFAALRHPRNFLAGYTRLRYFGANGGALVACDIREIKAPSAPALFEKLNRLYGNAIVFADRSLSSW